MSLVTPSHLGGNSSFAALVGLLDDPAKLKGKLEQLKKAEESANAVIALAGPASEIVQLRESIEHARKEADQNLADSHKEAGAIVQTARQEAEKIVRDAQEAAQQSSARAQKTVDAAAEKMQEVQTAQGSAIRLAAEAKQARQALDSDKQALIACGSELEELKEQLLKEKSQLAAVRETIDNLLG